MLLPLLISFSAMGKANPSDDMVVAILPKERSFELETVRFAKGRVRRTSEQFFTKAERLSLEHLRPEISSFRNHLAIKLAKEEIVAKWIKGKWQRLGTVGQWSKITLAWHSPNQLVYPASSSDYTEISRKNIKEAFPIYTAFRIGDVRFCAATGGYERQFAAYETPEEVSTATKICSALQQASFSRLSPKEFTNNMFERDQNQSLKFTPNEFGRFSHIGSVARSGNSGAVACNFNGKPSIVEFVQGRRTNTMPLSNKPGQSTMYCAFPTAVLTLSPLTATSDRLVFHFHNPRLRSLQLAVYVAG